MIEGKRIKEKGEGRGGRVEGEGEKKIDERENEEWREGSGRESTKKLKKGTMLTVYSPYEEAQEQLVKENIYYTFPNVF